VLGQVDDGVVDRRARGLPVGPPFCVLDDPPAARA
jgi:hypothetical protein